MKITAYTLFVFSALIWALLCLLAGHDLIRWWSYDRIEPYTDNKLIDSIALLIPPAGFVTVISSAFFLRQSARLSFVVSCVLTVATFVLGLAFLGWHGQGV